MASIFRTATRIALRGGAAGASVSASLLDEVARRLRERAGGDAQPAPPQEEPAPRLQAIDTEPVATASPARRSRSTGPAASPVRPSVAERTGSNTARNAGGRITKPKAARKVRKRQEAAAKTGDGGGA